MIPIFVGYDPREAVAYSVFCHSVLRNTREKIAFYPMRGDSVVGSTSFNAERFKVAKEMGYRGWAIWSECDMLMRPGTDIADLMRYADSWCDVVVAKHSYRTKHPVKFLGQKNEDYPRKNWSSLMLINCAHESWRRLEHTEFSLSELHRLAFIKDDRIGALPLEWNWLVGEYDFNEKAKLAHFTVGTPCWEEYSNSDYADEWRAEKAMMLNYAKAELAAA